MKLRSEHGKKKVWGQSEGRCVLSIWSFGGGGGSMAGKGSSGGGVSQRSGPESGETAGELPFRSLCLLSFPFPPPSPSLSSERTGHSSCRTHSRTDPHSLPLPSTPLPARSCCPTPCLTQHRLCCHSPYFAASEVQSAHFWGHRWMDLSGDLVLTTDFWVLILKF